MRNFSPSAGWRHQLVLSLSPHSLCILHFYRGLLGWKRAHELVVPLPEGGSVLSWRVPLHVLPH